MKRRHAVVVDPGKEVDALLGIVAEEVEGEAEKTLAAPERGEVKRRPPSMVALPQQTDTEPDHPLRKKSNRNHFSPQPCGEQLSGVDRSVQRRIMHKLQYSIMSMNNE